MFGMYKATVGLSDQVTKMLPKVEALLPKVEAMLPKVEALIETSRSAVEESRATIVDIRQKSNQILDSGQRQIKSFELILSDAAERTTKQLAYAEAVVQDTLSRVEDTVGLVHRGVMKPIRGISGIAAGVGAAIQYLMRRSPNPERATLDEEMFI
jgi:hypothetical protein